MFILFLCLFITINSTGSEVHAAPRIKLILAVNDLPAYTKLHRDVYKAVNQQSDKFEFVLEFLPNRRTFIMANNGLVDGVAMKPDSLDPGELSNLIPISTPIYAANSIVAIHQESQDIPDQKALQKYTVALINGAIHAMNLVPPGQRVFVNSHLSGLLMVAHERIPAMLTLDIPYYTTTYESRDVASKTRLATFTRRIPFYIFVHRKHLLLIPELEALLKKVAASGAAQNVYDSIVDDLKKDLSLKK